MDLLDQIRPAIAEIAVILVTALAGLAVQRFRAWTGIEIEGKHREALQSALANGARIAVDEGLDSAVDYVLRSVPDALDALGAGSRWRIEELLAPHVGRAKALPVPGELILGEPAGAATR